MLQGCEATAERKPSRITSFAHEIAEAAEHAEELEEMTRSAVAELLGEEPTAKSDPGKEPCSPGVLGIYEDRLRNIRDSLNAITYQIHRMSQ